MMMMLRDDLVLELFDDRVASAGVREMTETAA